MDAAREFAEANFDVAVDFRRPDGRGISTSVPGGSSLDNRKQRIKS